LFSVESLEQRVVMSADGGFVRPDLALTDVEVEQPAAIAFVGGWGASSYQYAFEGTYYNSAYNASNGSGAAVNDLINDFVDQDKYVTAICHGVSVLAYARVDGVSPLGGRSAAGPTTAADDVFIDGKIITGENFDSASAAGKAVAEAVKAAATQSRSEPLPVLMVIANQDFYYQEYADTRASLEAAGLEVVVAAATTETATQEAKSALKRGGTNVDPDVAISDVKAEDYSAIVFINGYNDWRTNFGRTS
jgi:putative intracellular protease/amidase